MGIDHLRFSIDRIDAQLIDILTWRLEVAEQIAAYKAENGLPILDEAREAQKLASVREKALPGTEDAMEELFRAIMKVSRDWQAQHMETPHG